MIHNNNTLEPPSGVEPEFCDMTSLLCEDQQRPTSAPPNLEQFSAANLFMFAPIDHSILDDDIRLDEDYEDFYWRHCHEIPGLPLPRNSKGDLGYAGFLLHGDNPNLDDLKHFDRKNRTSLDGEHQHDLDDEYLDRHSGHLGNEWRNMFNYNPSSNGQQFYPNYGIDDDTPDCHRLSYKGPKLNDDFYPSNTVLESIATQVFGNDNSNRSTDTPITFSTFAGDCVVDSEDFKGRVHKICQDQAGCRMLQRKLDEGRSNDIHIILNEVLEHMAELMTDPFGNYLCQKLLEVANDFQLSRIVDTIAPSLVSISLNMHGTRAVQKLVEVIQPYPAFVNRVIESFQGHVVDLVRDLNGNHVIQRFLSCLSASQNEFIYTSVAKYCVQVATHRHGCCVFQRCIDSANEKQRYLLFAELTRNVLELVEDPFGNYVIQYTVNLNDMAVNQKIAQCMLPKIRVLCKQKFASNVVERCLVNGNTATKRKIIDEFLKDGPRGMRELLIDSFANYVVQKALSVCEADQQLALLEGIKPNLDEMRKSSGGERVVSKLLKKYPNVFNSGGYESGQSGRSKTNPKQSRIKNDNFQNTVTDTNGENNRNKNTFNGQENGSNRNRNQKGTYNSKDNYNCNYPFGNQIENIENADENEINNTQNPDYKLSQNNGATHTSNNLHNFPNTHNPKNVRNHKSRNQRNKPR